LLPEFEIQHSLFNIRYSNGAVAQLVEQRTENPCVAGSIPAHTTRLLVKAGSFLFMFFVYILYSMSGDKTYVGFTHEIDRRLREHNFTEAKGFTLRYRPWTLIHSEYFPDKSSAVKREKFLKTGRGRAEVRLYVECFLNDPGAVSAAAEKD
jgi:putative endonuclease